MILLSLSLTAKSQIDAVGLTLMPQLPYGNLYNPALPVSSNMYIGVGISNVNLSVYNSSIRYKNIYNYENGKLVSINATQLINSLDEHDNFINTNFSLDVLRMGFRIKKLFIDIDWNVRYSGEIHYSRDFLGFFVNGNGNYMGDKYADFSVGVNTSLVSEIAVGVQYAINDKLNVALRPKMLCGVANIKVTDDNTKIYTDENTYNMIADVDLNFQMASLVDLGIERLEDLYTLDLSQLNFADALRLKDNFGYAVDFGVSYTFNKHFGVAAGVYDLGFIKWKNSKQKHQVQDNVLINDAFCKDFDDLKNLDIDFETLFKDLVRDVWGDGTLEAGGDYITNLNTRIMLQGYYELIPMVRFTAIGQMYYINQKVRPSLTLAYSGTFFKFLDFSTSYTFGKYSGDMLSLGVTLGLGPVKIYAVSDNILVLSKRKSSPIEMLTSYEHTNIRLGLLLSLDRK